jgi:hypothetical protein
LYNKINTNNLDIITNQTPLTKDSDILFKKNISIDNLKHNNGLRVKLSTSDIDAYLRPITKEIGVITNDIPESFKKGILTNIFDMAERGISNKILMSYLTTANSKITNNININNYSITNNQNPNIGNNINTHLGSIITNESMLENTYNDSTDTDNYTGNVLEGYGSKIPISLFLDLDKYKRQSTSY